MTRRLTLEETSKCLVAWRQLQDKDALTLLVVCNEGLVHFIARRYLDKGLTFEELVSAGNEGLINAINKFDYIERDIQAFSTYISVSIENAIKQELKKFNKHSHVLSFSQPIVKHKDGDELTIEDIIGTDSEELIDNAISVMKISVVKEALKCLTLKERQVILLRYGLDDKYSKTLEEIGQLFGVTKQYIRQIEAKALRKLRHPKNTRKLKDFL